MPKKNTQKLRSTPPLSRRLELFAQVLEELATVAVAEPDPVRAQKLRGIARRLSVALRINEVVGVEWAQAAASARGSAAGKRPRPNALKPMPEAVKRIMLSGKRRGTTADEFLKQWESEPIQGLRLTFDRVTELFTVTDENMVMPSTEYTLKSLRTMYSRAPRRRLKANRR